jgi:hypothetical protein
MADGGTGGLLANVWIKSGPGTIANSPGYLSILSDGVSYTSATQEVTVTPGKLHRFSYRGEGVTLSRKVGSTQEADNYIPSAAGVLGTQNIPFTPTTNKAWVQFQRLSNNTAIANDLRLSNLDPKAGSARILNGSGQYFYQDNQTFQFTRTNANFYIGGWWNFSAVSPTSGFYIYDFGIVTTATTAGVGRVRLIFDPVQNRLIASNQAMTGAYREQYFVNPGFVAGTPVYLGIAVGSNGDPYPVLGTRRGGGTVSGSLPVVQADLGQQIRIGANARTSPSAASYAAGKVWDVIWNIGGIPPDTALNAMALGQRPHQITGFTPSYHWPMVGPTTTHDEESINLLSTLRQVGSPGIEAAPPDEPAPGISSQLGWMVI